MADPHQSEEAASGPENPERRHVSPHGRNDRRIPWEEESSVVQAWLAQGRAEGEVKALAEGREDVQVEVARRMLLDIGTVVLGPPSPEVVDIIEKITDADRLHAMITRFMVPVRWEVLLATPVKRS
jgi:hypothetical protein